MIVSSIVWVVEAFECYKIAASVAC